jgi:hypothetical protein
MGFSALIGEFVLSCPVVTLDHHDATMDILQSRF